MNKFNIYLEATKKKIIKKADNKKVDDYDEFLDRICHDIHYAIRYESDFDDGKKAFDKVVAYYRKYYYY